MKKRISLILPATILILAGLAQAGSAIRIDPLVSRGLPVYVSHETACAGFLTDADYFGQVWHPGKDLPCWAAIRLDRPYDRVLVYLKVKGWGPYDDPGFTLVDYEIQTSPDSTDARDGHWTTAVSVKGNDKMSRTHVFAMNGAVWVRLSVTAWNHDGDHGGLETIDIHDASRGTEDTWFFLGDSIFQGAFGQRGARIQPDFAAVVNAESANPARTPVMVSGAHGGVKARWGLENIGRFMQEQPGIRYWCVNLGMNDSRGDRTGDKARAEEFKRTMAGIVKAVLDAGRVPILAPITCASGEDHLGIPVWNRRINELVREYHLARGPDLYSWFKAHPEELGKDGVHPNPKGSRSINRLWAEAALRITKDPGTNKKTRERVETRTR